MKRITYRVTFHDGVVEDIVIYARTLNSGFTYALKAAKQRVGGELSRIEVWVWERA